MQGKAFSKLQCLPKDRFSKRTSGVVSPPLGKTDSCHKGKQDTLPHPHTGGHGPLSFTALLKVSSSLPYITHFLLTHPSSSSLPHEAMEYERPPLIRYLLVFLSIWQWSAHRTLERLFSCSPPTVNYTDPAVSKETNTVSSRGCQMLCGYLRKGSSVLSPQTRRD